MKKIKILVCILLLLSLSLTGCESIFAGLVEIPDNTVSGGGKPTLCDTCIDENDDGECDVCRGDMLVIFDIFAINDLHGKLVDDEDQPGVEELTTYLKNAQSKNENTILLSSGDMWQGSAESNLTHGALMTEWMNELDFASMTLGNHEFDWGEDRIGENAEIAEFPFLAINIFDSTTGERADFCEASVVIEKNGLEIGIIGAIGDVHSSISGEVVGDMYFKVGNQLTSLVKDEATRLRSEGVDFIIYSIHSDSSDYDYSLSNGYVDLVFEGHTHQDYAEMDSYGVYHLQNGGENEGISHASLAINKANGSNIVLNTEVVSSSVYSIFEEHPAVDGLIDKYTDDIAWANETMVTTSRYYRSTDILTICSELYYNAGVEKWGSEYEIAAGGGFMSARSPYDLQRGNVSYADVYSILPFDNQLVLCEISGYDLNRIMKQNRYYVYTDGVSSFDSAKTYYIITDTYSSTYKYNNMTEIARYTPNVYARDLFSDYLKVQYGK